MQKSQTIKEIMQKIIYNSNYVTVWNYWWAFITYTSGQLHSLTTSPTSLSEKILHYYYVTYIILNYYILYRFNSL